MVLIEFKKSENNTFLTELPAATSVEAVLVELVGLCNLRVRIEKLAAAMEALAEFGPLRPEALRGLTTPETYNPAFEGLSEKEREFMLMLPGPGQELRPDPTGYRCGRGLVTEARNRLLQTTQQAKEFISAKNAQAKRLFLSKEAQEMLLLLRGATMIAFPGFHGLPEWEPVCMILEDKFNFLAHFPDCDWLDEDKSVLWWAKKELQKGKTIADYVGKNEKTKIVVKIMPKGKGAPLSEPPIDQETHKKMLSYYYKKQEEVKRLEEENEDDYLNSQWANPGHLKSQLVNGGRGINLRPFK